MAHTRNASSVLFGFDFQRNAAIILALENIRDLQSMRLEGNDEDIELTMVNGKKILAQAKSVVRASSDFNNVLGNLEKALSSLSEGAQKVDAQQLVFITNSSNPFKDDESRGIFSGFSAHRSYSDLPETAQKKIVDYLIKNAITLDLDKLAIQTFQFETNNPAERYKVVLDAIKEFIGSFQVNVSYGLDKQLLQVWHNQVFINGTKYNTDIELSKKDIVWPILVIETEVNQCDEDLLNELDPALYDEVVRAYKDVINTCCERIEFFTQVLYDYSTFKDDRTGKARFYDFVNYTWESYKENFRVDRISDDVLEALTKIVLYNIVRRRILIDRVKEAANL